LKSATGDLLPVIGQVNLLLNERFEHSFVVVKEFRFDVLLGLDFLKKFDAIELILTKISLLEILLLILLMKMILKFE